MMKTLSAAFAGFLFVALLPPTQLYATSPADTIVLKLKGSLPAPLRLATSVGREPACLQASTDFTKIVEAILADYNRKDSDQWFKDLIAFNRGLLCLNDDFVALLDQALKDALEPIFNELRSNPNNTADQQVLQALFNTQLFLIDTNLFTSQQIGLLRKNVDLFDKLSSDYPGIIVSYSFETGLYDIRSLKDRSGSLNNLDRSKLDRAQREELERRIRGKDNPVNQLANDIAGTKEWGVGCRMGMMIDLGVCCMGVTCNADGSGALLQNSPEKTSSALPLQTKTSDVTASFTNGFGATGVSIVNQCCIGGKNIFWSGKLKGKSLLGGSDSGTTGNDNALSPFSPSGNGSCKDGGLKSGNDILVQKADEANQKNDAFLSCFGKYGNAGGVGNAVVPLGSHPAGIHDSRCLAGQPGGGIEKDEEPTKDEQPKDDAKDKTRDPTPAEKEKLDQQKKDAADKLAGKEKEVRSAYEKKNGAQSSSGWSKVWNAAVGAMKSAAIAVTDGRVADLFENGSSEQAATATMKDGSKVIKVIIVDKYQAMGVEGAISNEQIMAHELLHVGFGDSLDHRDITRIGRSVGGMANPEGNSDSSCDDPTGAVTRAKNLFECEQKAVGASVGSPPSPADKAKLQAGQSSSGIPPINPQVTNPGPEGSGLNDCSALSVAALTGGKNSCESKIQCPEESAAKEDPNHKGSCICGGGILKQGGNRNDPCDRVQCPEGQRPIAVGNRCQCSSSGFPRNSGGRQPGRLPGGGGPTH